MTNEFDTKILPCNGCTACCQGDAIFMHPEEGDDASQYKTEEYLGRIILAHKPNRDCIYLNRNTGCTIWERRPSVCRTLDCRILLKLPFDKRGLASKGMLKAARRMKEKMRFKQSRIGKP